jgi:predicted RND superfamily exporter protein
VAVRVGGVERYVDWVIAHRRAVVVALVAATAFWASRLPSLQVEIDPDANLPQDHPYIEALKVLEDRFGEKNLIVVGLFPRGGTVYDPAFLAKLVRITRRIRDIPGLVRSSYLSIASPLVKAIEGDGDALLVRPVLEGDPTVAETAAETRRRLHANPFYVGTVVAADGSAAAIIANFRLSESLRGYPQIQERVAAEVAAEQDGSFDVHYGGTVAVTSGLARITERTIVLFPIALLVIGLIHYEAFRTLQGMVLPLVTAIMAVLWSLGLMGLLAIPLDPFNTTTPVLILAVAAGHAVQVLKRYYEELDRHRDSIAAVRIALVRMAPVMVTAGTVASLSFFSLTAFATATMRNFGLLAGFGILSALVVELTLIPALRALLPAPRAREMAREARSGRLLERLLRGLARAISARPAAVIALGLAIAAAATFGASRLRIDTSFKRQFGAGDPVRVADDALNRAFAGTNTLVFLVGGPEDGALRDPRVLGAIADLQRFVETAPAVGKTLSITDFVRELHRAMSGDPGADGLPASPELVSQYLFLYSLAGDPEALDSQIDAERRNAAVRVFLHDDSTQYGEDLLARVRSHVAATFPPDYTVRYSGTVASNAALTEVMVQGKILNMVQIAAIIVVVAGLALRSALAGMLVAVPLAVAVLVNFGVMGLLGVPLDIMTAPIAAMAVGIGSDYAIYFLFRFREELAVSGTRTLALASTLQTSGKAIVYVSSAIAGGYLTLCASGFVFHLELGGLVSLAMVVSSLAAITLLPALVLAIEPAFLFETVRPLDRAPAGVSWDRLARASRGAASRESP